MVLALTNPLPGSQVDQGNIQVEFPGRYFYLWSWSRQWKQLEESQLKIITPSLIRKLSLLLHVTPSSFSQEENFFRSILIISRHQRTEVPSLVRSPLPLCEAGCTFSHFLLSHAISVLTPPSWIPVMEQREGEFSQIPSTIKYNKTGAGEGRFPVITLRWRRSIFMTDTPTFPAQSVHCEQVHFSCKCPAEIKSGYQLRDLTQISPASHNTSL